MRNDDQENEVHDNPEEMVEDDNSEPVSPTSKLRHKMQARQQLMRVQLHQNFLTPPIKREMIR